jgi:stearoyl-CoA desaturase (delta-9 desaturase)
MRMLFAFSMIVASYFALALFPWYLLPFAWFLCGTACTGLFGMGYACRQESFFRHDILNHIFGQICMLPVLIPFESWKQSFSFEELFAESSFWWLSSPWQFICSNFAFVYMSLTKRMIANFICLYLFAAIVFPLLTYNLGVWGLLKFYIIPLVIYHFWVSCFIKSGGSVDLLIPVLQDSDLANTATLTYTKFPNWLEWISLDVNYSIALARLKSRWNQIELKMAPYKAKGAFEEIKKATNLKLDEVSFNYRSLLFQVKKEVAQTTAESSKKISECRDVIKEKIDAVMWPTAIFLFVTPPIGLYGIITLPFIFNTYLVGFLHYYLGGIGITAGYHRLFAHRSYEAHPIVRAFFLLLGTGAFEGSALDWSLEHRDHHRFVDTNKDPYNVKRGFWYAHMGWLLFKRPPCKSNVSDLAKDPLIAFQDKYYTIVALFVNFCLPTLICGLGWGDWLGGFLIAGVASTVFIMQCTFCINSVAHYFGDQPYTDQKTSRDSGLVSLITFGEGYHNFHHEFPYDYRNGVNFYDFDPGKWVIRTLEYAGLVYKVKRFSPETIEKGRIQMDEKKLQQRKERLHWGAQPETLPFMPMDEIVRRCSPHGKEPNEREHLLVIDGVVYDVLKFVDEHPGGKGFIKAYLGKDATKAFNGGVYKHSVAAQNTLKMFAVARLEVDEHEKLKEKESYPCIDLKDTPIPKNN